MGRVQNITQPFSHIPLCEGQIASGFCGGNNIPVFTKSSELIEFAEYRRAALTLAAAGLAGPLLPLAGPLLPAVPFA
jgi:hypothetical protein